MYTTIIHPLRKTYCLSINEYCVLEAIRGLANNTKYSGWCVMSQKRIANALDLSTRTIIRAYKKLEDVNLIEKRKETITDTAVRSADEWNEWFMADKADMLLGLKTGKNELASVLPSSVSSSDKMSQGVVTNCHKGSDKMSHNTNRDTYIDINKKKKKKEKKKEFQNFIEKFNVLSEKNFHATDKLFKKYVVRRKVYSYEELLQSADGLTKDDFMSGNNENEKYYATPEYLLRNDENVDKYINHNQTCKPNRMRVVRVPHGDSVPTL